MKTDEIVKKIKSIDKWKWYYEENDFDDFYLEFQEKYPNIDLDKNQIKRIVKSLVEGKEIPSSITEEIQGKNVAFRCTFNDSGFKGRCSEKMCNHNWIYGGNWCRNSDNLCREKESYPCMESAIWENFSFGAGSYLKGEKYGIKKSLKNVCVGKVAFLTTVKPIKDKKGNLEKNDEKERFFFGVLDIIKLKTNEDSNQTNSVNAVIGSEKFSIKIHPKIKVKFWDFYENENAKSEMTRKNKWGSGRTRSIFDNQALAILTKLKNEYIKNNLDQKEIDKIDRLITRFE